MDQKEEVLDPHHLENGEICQNKQIDNKNGEVGLVDAPDGGRAAWTVVFGSFCVIDEAH